MADILAPSTRPSNGRSGPRICVIGGGSVFTPELIQLFAENAGGFGPMEIRLMDINQDRLKIVGEFCQRIAAGLGGTIEFVYADTYEEAIEGADFILLQFRQGGVTARIADERLGLKYRLPFTETISVCGFATFLRTYPVMERLAEIIGRLAPEAWVMNFTNPAGMLTESLHRLGCEKALGICNGSIHLRDFLAEKIGASPDEIFMSWRGLNHLTATDAVYCRGKNILPEVLAGLGDYEGTPFPASLIRTLGFIPNGYLQYYFMRETTIRKLQTQGRLRSEVVAELEERLLAIYAQAKQVPEELKQRGGYGYSRVVADLIRGIVLDDRSLHYVMVRNGSCLPELPADAIVEVPVLAKADGVRAVQVDRLPEAIRGLAVTMKQYERVLIEAARTRDRRLLLTALLIHPLTPSFDDAQAILADVLETNRAFLPEYSG